MVKQLRVSASKKAILAVLPSLAIYKILLCFDFKVSALYFVIGNYLPVDAV